MTAPLMQKRLAALGDAETAKSHAWFFKTGPGGYGEGDLFRGIRVPALRAAAKEFEGATVEEVTNLLQSPYHEDRLLALILWMTQSMRSDEKQRTKIYRLYLKNTARINNWDLVDISAGPIVGAYLWDKDRTPLYKLVKSASLWERRIAIIATQHFIRQGDMDDTLKIAELLLGDRHDLIHKAVGWMLREVGKRDLPAEEAFLKAHCRIMPRTMLRYAIEKFPEAERQAYLKGEV